MNETKYTCAICGKSYTDISERIACETKCFADRKAAEEKKRQMELARDKAASEEEVIAWIMDAEDALRNHLTQFGAITINKDFPYLRYIFGNAKFWF